jgi:hypothetical protein
MMDESVIPECFVDTNLIETLVPPQTRYNHQKGCGTVTKIMKERFADRFALGVIDKDKHQVDYLKEFEEVCNTDSLILHKHRTRHHYIIQISPAIERFIINNALAAGIALTDFGLPSDFDLLIRESKKVNSKNDPRFKRLFRSLMQFGAPDLQRLSSWVSYLKDNNYYVDLAVIQSM